MKNLSVTISLIICVIIFVTCGNKTSNFDAITTESNFISGLSPVDVYLNMEKQGFSVDSDFSEYGNSWICKKDVDGINFTVDMYSSNKNNVENVRATAMIDVVKKDITATQQFFSYIASLPYEGSEPHKAQQWIIDNFNNDKSAITIGNVIFTINAPSKAVRILYIEKEKQ